MYLFRCSSGHRTYGIGFCGWNDARQMCKRVVSLAFGLNAIYGQPGENEEKKLSILINCENGDHSARMLILVLLRTCERRKAEMWCSSIDFRLFATGQSSLGHARRSNYNFLPLYANVMGNNRSRSVRCRPTPQPDGHNFSKEHRIGWFSNSKSNFCAVNSIAFRVVESAIHNFNGRMECGQWTTNIF